MKAPKNFYNTVDQRKLGLEDGLLPDVTAADNGKVLKVADGKWKPGDDENTIIEANPDEQPTVDLENLKIGDTVYSVKNPELTSINSFKLTMSNGGQYNTNKPIIEFFNEAGQEASITSSDYTVECDKTYAGNAGMDQVCSIVTPDTPGTFTYTFVNEFDIDTYKLIKLTRGGAFPNDIAKNIKIELSVDGENYITIYDETTITWSDAVPYHLISLKDGSEASTLLPIVTSADNGKVLGVVGGVWDKMNVPTELPDAYNHIRIVNTESSFSGAWTKDTSDPTEIVFTGSLDTTKFKAYGRKPFGSEVDITNDFGSNQNLCNYPNTTIEFDFELSGLKITVIPLSSITKIRKGSLQLGSFKYVGVMYDPVAKNYNIMGEISITFSSDFSTVTITVST